MRRRYTERLFQQLDADADGILTGDEIHHIPDPPRDPLRGYTVPRRFSDPATTARPSAELADGGITLGELDHHLNATNRRSFSIELLNRPAPVNLGRNRSSPNVIWGDFLFRKLDANGDDVLGRKELLAAAGLLRRLDANDDDLITSYEINPLASPSYVRAAGSTGAASSGRQPTFLNLIERPDDATLVAARLIEFQEHLASETAPAVSKLQEFLSHIEPTVAVTIRLGRRRPGQPAVELQSSSQVVSERRVSDPSTLQIRIESLNLVISAEADSGQNDTERLADLFRRLDSNRNSYLARRETVGNHMMNRMFRALDGNGDGLLYLDEASAWVNRESQAATSRIVLTIRDDARYLFGFADRNRDGRLSVRELRDFPDRLAAMDNNGDGAVSRTEIPRQFSLHVARARVPLFPYATDALQERQPESDDLPRWFVKMDRNRDRDVSRREFLGGDRHFQTYDDDQDGLISAAEACRKER